MMVHENGKSFKNAKIDGAPNDNTPKAKEGNLEEEFSSAFKLGISISLFRKGPEENRQRSPSPKPKISPKKSFRDRGAKFEKVKELKDKYRNQRNVKAMTKTKSNIKKIKASPEKPKESVSLLDLLREIRADIKEIKGDVKSNNSKIDKMNSKISNLEERTEKTEIENSKKF